MYRKTGKYVEQKLGDASYKAYVPFKLPPYNPDLDLIVLKPYLEKATHALKKLSDIHQTIPNTTLFLLMHVRKEALLSSQIEGTQSSFSDLMIFENHEKPEVAIDDVEEVSNYIKAIKMYDSESSSEAGWIEWFCDLEGHEFFVAVSITDQI